MTKEAAALRRAVLRIGPGEGTLLIVAVAAAILAGTAERVEDRIVAGVFGAAVAAAGVVAIAMRRTTRRTQGGFVADEIRLGGVAEPSFICVRLRRGQTLGIVVMALLGLVGIALVVYPEALASRLFPPTVLRAVGFLTGITGGLGCMLEATRQVVGGYVALLPAGVVWRAFETGTAFVPWDEVAEVELETIGPQRVLGLRVAPGSSARLPWWARPVARFSRWAYGYEFLCPVDSIPMRPEDLRQALRHYVWHREARREIGTAAELQRLEGAMGEVHTWDRSRNS